LGYLRKHELGHYQKSREWAPRFRDRCLGLVPEERDAEWDKCVAEHQQDQDAYDVETDHGRTQGAVLDTSKG